MATVITDAEAAQLLGYPKPFDPNDPKGTPRELLININKAITPTLKQGLEDQQAGELTIPRLARGVLTGTLVGDLNNQLSHSCDFILEAKKNLKLRAFIEAVAGAIKRGVLAIVDALGLEPTGTLSNAIAFLRRIASYLKYIKKNYIDPIIEFEKYVILYIQQVKAMIEFINNLPAKLKALLKTCLANLTRLLSSVFTDIISEALGTGDDGIGAAIIAAKDVVDQANIVYNGVQTVINTGSTIVNEVKSIDLSININAASFSDILPSKEAVDSYISTIPNAALVRLTNPPPQQQRSSP
jgi:hypothetical protein